MPFSVMKPWTRRPGVTSKAGFQTLAPSGATLVPPKWVTSRALRFYEARGLLSPQRSGGERRYGQDARDRMVFILQAKRLGFTVREIRELL